MSQVADHPASGSLAEGWAVYAVEFDSWQSAQFVTLGLGSRAKALGPEEWRLNVAAEIERVRARLPAVSV